MCTNLILEENLFGVANDFLKKTTVIEALIQTTTRICHNRDLKILT